MRIARMQIFQIKTIHTDNTNKQQKHMNTNLQKSLDSSLHYGGASCPSLPRTGAVAPVGVGTKRQYRRTVDDYFIHKLWNNHTDVVILCCDWDSVIVDVVVGHDVRPAQPSWLVGVFVS